MRIWYGVEPGQLCQWHLLGEHRECHAMLGLVKRQMDQVIKGHVSSGQFHPRDVWQRHLELVMEMERRGFAHRSPLEIEDKELLDQWNLVQLPCWTVNTSIQLLRSRCTKCQL